MSAQIIPFPRALRQAPPARLRAWATPEDLELVTRGKALLHDMVHSRTLRARQRAQGEYAQVEADLVEATVRVVATLSHIQGRSS